MMMPEYVDICLWSVSRYMEILISKVVPRGALQGSGGKNASIPLLFLSWAFGTAGIGCLCRRLSTPVSAPELLISWQIQLLTMVCTLRALTECNSTFWYILTRANATSEASACLTMNNEDTRPLGPWAFKGRRKMSFAEDSWQHFCSCHSVRRAGKINPASSVHSRADQSTAITISLSFLQ